MTPHEGDYLRTMQENPRKPGEALYEYMERTRVLVSKPRPKLTLVRDREPGEDDE